MADRYTIDVCNELTGKRRTIRTSGGAPIATEDAACGIAAREASRSRSFVRVEVCCPRGRVLHILRGSADCRYIPRPCPHVGWVALDTKTGAMFDPQGHAIRMGSVGWSSEAEARAGIPKMLRLDRAGVLARFPGYAAIRAAAKENGWFRRFSRDLTLHDRRVLAAADPSAPFAWCMWPEGTHLSGPGSDTAFAAFGMFEGVVLYVWDGRHLWKCQSVERARAMFDRLVDAWRARETAGAA
jgi:hypothetical protein